MCSVFVLSRGGPPISIKETTQLEQVFQKLQRIGKGYRSKKGLKMPPLFSHLAIQTSYFKANTDLDFRRGAFPC
jgi:hypothetical protein